MLFRFTATLFLSLLLTHMARADTWCDFEIGMLGSKAIGYVPPGSLAPYNRSDNRYDDEAAKTCQILFYDAPKKAAEGGVVRPCEDFLHVPSRYVTEGNPGGPTRNLAASEYFRIQVFASEADFLEVRLKTGEKAWVRTHGSDARSYIRFRHDEGWASTNLSGKIGPSPIYLAPSFDELDPFVEVGAYQLIYAQDIVKRAGSFFDHPVFEFVGLVGAYDPSEKLAYMNEQAWKTGFYVQYRMVDIVKGENDWLWYKANEFLVQDTIWWVYDVDIDALDVSDVKKQEYKALIYKVFESEPLRTVYFPYRAPDKTIVTVLEMVGDGC